MKIIYIAHPIGGDVTNNLTRVKNLIRKLYKKYPKGHQFIAPYYLDCRVLNDNIPDERARGMRHNEAYFKKKFIDEVWLFGTRISAGMLGEVQLAERYGLPVMACTIKTVDALRAYQQAKRASSELPSA